VQQQGPVTSPMGGNWKIAGSWQYDVLNNVV